MGDFHYFYLHPTAAAVEFLHGNPIKCYVLYSHNSQSVSEASGNHYYLENKQEQTSFFRHTHQHIQILNTNGDACKERN